MKSTLWLSFFLLSAFAPVAAQAQTYRYTPPPPMPMNFMGPNTFRYGASAPALRRKTPGLLITAAHDTIRGTIICRSFSAMQKKVTVVDDSKQKINYQVDQLAGMVIKPAEGAPLEFETKRIEGETYCVHRLVNGYVKLYAKYYTAAGGTEVPSYYVQKGTHPVAHFGTFKAGLGSDNFRKTARDYFHDYADLARKLDEKEYKFQDIVKVFEAYNTWHESRPGVSEGKKKDNF